MTSPIEPSKPSESTTSEEASTEVTRDVTAEATTEATADVTAEATVDVTVNVTPQTTPEAATPDQTSPSVSADASVDVAKDVSADDAPQPFSLLPLSAEMLDNLEQLEYHEMTPIQAQSLPHLLEGRDLIARAKTGSGKTAAFGIALLAQLVPDTFRVQSLVICPTRELATQVAQEIRRLARAIPNVKVLTLSGGKPFGPQVGSLEHGAHIIVGTPGRICKHLKTQTLSLEHLQILVLDEADRMIDMGFSEEVDEIIAACPGKRQTLMFSATYPDEIRSRSEALLVDPVEVIIEAEAINDDIEQKLYKVGAPDEKLGLLEFLLLHHQPTSVLVFCNQKRDAQGLADDLVEGGFAAMALHGDLMQEERDEILVAFRNQSCTILVATDVAARGLDIDGLDLVINFDLTRDPEVHIHRVGRTGRAGQTGLALSLAAPNDKRALAAIQSFRGQSIPVADPQDLDLVGKKPKQPAMVTLCIDGGRKRKVRPGDILGALTKDAGLEGRLIGKIEIFDHKSYIAVDQSIVEDVLEHVQTGKIKGRSFRIRRAF